MANLTTPVTMMMMSAKILVKVKMSWTLVAHATFEQLMNVSIAER